MYVCVDSKKRDQMKPDMLLTPDYVQDISSVGGNRNVDRRRMTRQDRDHEDLTYVSRLPLVRVRVA